MHDYFNPSIIEGFKFGSFTRKTILPRSVDEKSDVDYMVVFADGGEYTPQTYLDRLKGSPKSATKHQRFISHLQQWY